MFPSSPLRRRLCYALANMDPTNKLYFGDNLKILREYVPDASVDLIYLDPPFNTGHTESVCEALPCSGGFTPPWRGELAATSSGEESAAFGINVIRGIHHAKKLGLCARKAR